MKYFLPILLITSLFWAGCESKKPITEKPGIAVETPPVNHVPVEVVREKAKGGAITVSEKKKRFKDKLVPAITETHDDLQEQYEKVREDLNGDNPSDYSQMMKDFRAETNDELLQSLKPHPISIVLAQAAMESAWGTSRFFRVANNVFGVWSFDEGEARIAAGVKRGGDTIYVRQYDDLRASIKDYYRVLARGSAFESFRERRVETEDPFELVKELDKYSEKGAEYGDELASIIRFNKFTEFDN